MFDQGGNTDNAGEWINIHQDASLQDNFAKVLPGVGNFLTGLISAPIWAAEEIFTDGEGYDRDDWVADCGGQWNSESGAHNISTDRHHRDAMGMFVDNRTLLENTMFRDTTKDKEKSENGPGKAKDDEKTKNDVKTKDDWKEEKPIPL